MIYRMPLSHTITAFRKGSETCLDLGAGTDLHSEPLRKWRKAIAKEVTSGQLRFVSGRTQVLHKGGKEFPVQAKAVRFDECWQRVDEFYSPDGLQDVITRENRRVMEALIAQLRSSVGIVPFVGAGLSVDFGVPSWPQFLTDAAEFHDSPEKVLAEIKANRLIQAATLLATDPDRFQAIVATAFGGAISPQQTLKFAVGRLPMLAAGPVITTNFDSVLETAFLRAGAQFDRVITGTEPDNVIRAMHRNEHALIKIHGDAEDRTARVFTGLEYDAQYKGISKLARVMFTNRPLLFLGCSLDKDRTLEVLEAIHEEIPGLAHYAVLAGYYRVSRTRARRDELARYGISPLWFVPGEFRRIEEILAELILEASTRLIWRNPAPTADVQSSPVRPPRQHLDHPNTELHPELDPLIRQLARRVVQGRLAFFLGAGAHLHERFSARYFYRALGEEYGFDAEGVRRADVAQYMIDQTGKSAAWATAKQILLAKRIPAGAVYQFLAELPGVLRNSGRPKESRQWILTTNYDDVLERVLAGAGEIFHLLYYNVDGRYEGRFVHRDPQGTVRSIERPKSISTLPGPAHVLAKLDGGVARNLHIAETVTICPMDSIVSAGQLPAALPEAMRSALDQRSLLILGSSLKDAHVQRFVRWSAGNTRVIKTWAIAKGFTPDDIQYWKAAGVVVVDCDLSVFIRALRSRVLQLLSGA
jgi:hypothetical protein